MATLNSSNISNGNTIEPNDLLQLYDAFNYNGAATKYNVSISGSLQGEATSADTANSAGEADLSSLLRGQASIGGNPRSTELFYPIAGVATVSSGVATSVAFTTLIGLTPGTEVFITATYLESTSTTRNITIDSIDGNGSIVFTCSGAGDGERIMYIALVIDSL